MAAATVKVPGQKPKLQTLDAQTLDLHLDPLKEGPNPQAGPNLEMSHSLTAVRKGVCPSSTLAGHNNIYTISGLPYYVFYSIYSILRPKPYSNY